MFRCELCEHVPELAGLCPDVLPPRTRAFKVPIKVRAAEYPSRPKAHTQRVGRRAKHFDDPGGAGYEIAKEVLSCEACAKAYEAKQGGLGEIVDE
ncbi:MAG: hypothetical protein AAGE52_15800 [Myxococcota bacterium]